MGLISEMICKHNGIPILKNVTFIFASNPYRTLTKEEEKKVSDRNNKLKHLIMKKKNILQNFKERKKVLNLVYTVNPFPHSLLNFVFDFWNLTLEDEKRYIESMVSKTIMNIYGNDLDKSDYEYIQNLEVTAIVNSQNFIRKKKWSICSFIKRN